MSRKQRLELCRKYSKENSLFVIEVWKEIRATDVFVVKRSSLMLWLLFLTLGMASKMVL